jgi:hypothetical protein
MTIDAYDTVTFQQGFMDSIADGQVGDRLEVASRITEWLEDAVGRLPFPADLTLPDNYTYVMRGAGLENPDISDGRAWVLESKVPAVSAAPVPEALVWDVAGCPELMDWLAQELGIQGDKVQVHVLHAYSDAESAVGNKGSILYKADVQWCQLCSRLRDTAMVLQDPDGSHVAALAGVVSEFVTVPAPPSEEQMAVIASTLAEHAGDDTYYATAGRWLDALAQYVEILTTEIGLPADEAVAMASEKYVEPVAASADAALAAYLQMQLEGIAG